MTLSEAATSAVNIKVTEIQTNASKRWLRLTSCAHSALDFRSDGHANKRRPSRLVTQSAATLLRDRSRT